MATLRKYKIVVAGDGRFPVDMLRYDACWPATEQDAFAVGGDHDAEPRTVTLFAYHEGRGWFPTLGRWKSMGWGVTLCVLT